MTLLASPTLPGRGLNPACAAYGSSVEINDALLYATVAIAGTHAGVWTVK
jgi:hypothetical protein